ncbi:MAG: hypothetical protein Q3982_05110 [Phoenicibacter congonensis]|uniref:Uncharacterized protein n=1 Tax=Phoenicibacter congonensis TaxID=1944646 RepID=A0AA43U677_9ACTN|nr:hypothetical protein [Phoenicibacter congonensis]
MTTTIQRETITDARIIELNGLRDKPCMNEFGGCYIVSKARVFDDGEVFEVERVTDVNVFATEGEAEKHVARMCRSYVDSVIKYVYTVRYHHVKF